MTDHGTIDESPAGMDSAVGAAPDADSARFEWLDGEGNPWVVEGTHNRLTLSRDDEVRIFDRDSWRDEIEFSPLGKQVVLRFDLGDREVGFLIPMTDARTLFVAMGQTQAASAPPTEPEYESDEESDEAPAATETPLWPKMTTSSVLALCSSLLAFLPGIGVLFGISGIVLAVVARRAVRNNAAGAHVRTMCRISLIVAQVGIAISLLAVLAMVRTSHGRINHLPLGDEDLKWGWGAGIAAMVMVLLALSVHEAAHAITAWWCGDGLAKAQGRVTLNPLAHIDPFGTIFLPLLLMYWGAPVFGYARPVMTQLSGVKRYHRAQILVAGAGPLSNLMQAAVYAALLTAIGSVLSLMSGVQVMHLADMEPYVEVTGVAGAPVFAGIILMLKLGIAINVMLATFNLIPIPPLDGSWIVQFLFPGTIGLFYARIRPYGMFIFLAFIYLGGNLFVYCMFPGVIVILGFNILMTFVTGFV
ncbi:MAG: site-2 protease family protein [Phycisphaerales bacterium]|nr:site-2 protease family protein [Phycisphaerales bacterium]